MASRSLSSPLIKRWAISYGINKYRHGTGQRLCKRRQLIASGLTLLWFNIYCANTTGEKHPKGTATELFEVAKKKNNSYLLEILKFSSNILLFYISFLSPFYFFHCFLLMQKQKESKIFLNFNILYILTYDNKCVINVCLFCCPQVRISSWPKEIPGSWFSEFKRGKIVSQPTMVPSLLLFSNFPHRNISPSR